jgi:hypothetical protein
VPCALYRPPDPTQISCIRDVHFSPRGEGLSPWLLITHQRLAPPRRREYLVWSTTSLETKEISPVRFIFPQGTIVHTSPSMKTALNSDSPIMPDEHVHFSNCLMNVSWVENKRQNREGNAEDNSNFVQLASPSRYLMRELVQGDCDAADLLLGMHCMDKRGSCPGQSDHPCLFMSCYCIAR